MKNPLASLLANRRPDAAAGRASAEAFDGIGASAIGGREAHHVTRQTKGLLGIVLAAAAVLVVSLTLPASSPAAMAVFDEFVLPNGNKGGEAKAMVDLDVNLTGAGGVPAGTLYVVDDGVNRRVQQLSPNGSFVRAFGLNVAGAGVHVCTVAASCVGGTNSTAAAGLSEPRGIAVDQDTGLVFVSDRAQRRVNIYTAVGAFEGAFGWNVAAAGDPGDLAPAEGLELCTTACQAGSSSPLSELAGALGGPEGSLAFSPLSGNLYVPDTANARIGEFAISLNGSDEVEGVEFVRAIGWDVVPANLETGLETCTTLSGCKKGTTGNGPGQFIAGNSPGAIAVDTGGFVYALNSKPAFNSGDCSPAEPCGVLKFNPNGTFKENWGPTEGQCQVNYTEGVARSEQAFDIAVNTEAGPGENDVFLLKKTATDAYRVVQFDSDGGSDCTLSPVTDLPSGTGGNENQRGLAIGSDQRVFAHHSAANGGTIFELRPVPSPGVEMHPVDPETVTATSAEFEGTITVPEVDPGVGFETTYHFEYSANGIDWTSVPANDLSAGSAPGPVVVSVVASKLEPNTTYQARLAATTGSVVTSKSVKFTTDQAPPRIDLAYVDDVTQTSAALGAHINPQGLKSTYHFEWASEEEWEDGAGKYGHRVPAFERPIGGGREAVIVREEIAGLEPASTYHFRVVAKNAAEDGEVEGEDRTFETLNSCGLIEDRCFELVSPSEKGPVGAPAGGVGLTNEFKFQAAAGGSEIVYKIAYGLPDSSSGGEIIYEAQREDDGWSSSQVSAPLKVVGSQTSAASRALGFTPDLGCGAFTSSQSMAAGAPQATLDGGAGNLFRRSQDGTWSTISTVAPNNLPITGAVALGPAEYRAARLAAGSDGKECGRLFVTTRMVYPGVPGAGQDRVYEWDEGTVSSIGAIPGTPGPVEAVLGSAQNPDDTSVSSGSGLGSNFLRAVSEDGSRAYFTAFSQTGGDVGQQAVFLRQDGAVGVDISQSETGTANNDDSLFQTASVDGSVAFFTARYGLAQNDSSTGASTCQNDGAGCDLYRYDATEPVGERLTDLSPHGVDAGAGVVGVLDASEGGSQVYFAARGQLVAGEGPTEAENLDRDTYSVYLSSGDGARTEYVGVVAEGQALSNALMITPGAGGTGSTHLVIPFWSSRADSDGDHLVFESPVAQDTFEVQGNKEAYLFSADTGALECVSCRRDGLPSAASANFTYLANGLTGLNSLERPLSLVATETGLKVFFVSPNPLATGAVEGRNNLYVWDGGQIALVGTSPADAINSVGLAGASADGEDLYFTSHSRLTAEDEDGQADIYDARVGGRLAPPPASPTPCDPLVEGACQDATNGADGAVSPASGSLFGSGNVNSGAHNSSRCARRGKNARTASANAKRLRRAARNSSGRQARRLRLRARRAARNARRVSRAAKRCRGGGKTGTSRRAER